MDKIIKIGLFDDDINFTRAIANQLKRQDKNIEIRGALHFEAFAQIIANEKLDLIAIDLVIDDNAFNNTTTGSVLDNVIKLSPQKNIIVYSSQLSKIGGDLGSSSYNNLDFTTREHLIDKITDSIAKIRSRPQEEFFQNSLLIPANLGVILSDIAVVNKEWSEILKSDPQQIHRLTAREFEEFIAEIWIKKGYKVELTPETRDGGKDMYAYKKDNSGETLLAIECKKYNPSNKIGRPILQKLNGVVESEHLTGGILATTSYFTKDALKFANLVKYRIHLNDLSNLTEIIKNEL